MIFAGATIGFERLSYSFAEPGTGTSLFRENICVTVSQGILGFPLVIVPQWTAVTATGITSVRVLIILLVETTFCLSFSWSGWRLQSS